MDTSVWKMISTEDEEETLLPHAFDEFGMEDFGFLATIGKDINGGMLHLVKHRGIGAASGCRGSVNLQLKYRPIPCTCHKSLKTMHICTSAYLHICQEI